MLLVGLILTGCSRATPPPVQGLAVQGDGVVIDDWKYLGPGAVKEFPSEAANARAFGTSEYAAWVIWTDTGFDLVWGGGVCTTQPVVVVHAGSIEFWPGQSVPPPNTECVAVMVGHKLTVAMKTDIPPEQWRFTLHPPPNP